ncbi:isoleucine--tRNA ligase [Anaerolinea thermophila]|uniref:isoleucine--tRNA ligase n=4 Tax=Anaerolinea TaxID=233189 RepID=UPI0026E99924|nr:isoleucine--tRNA ligase [Anaerolinea thermophila]
MFKPVSPRVNVPVMEEGVLRFWKSHDIFHQSTQLREGAPEYVFFEGPPTANGKPGVHHVLARAFKDVFPRYKTMRGYHVIRRGGWDTHGLPVEIEVEKKLGFTNKQQIEDFGIARFNELCRESAFTYIQDWERLTERIAFWVDLEKAYITYTNDYIESVWWILKNFWDKGLIYRGYKVVPYCPRCGTPLSDHEVALGYDEATDPSVFVRMPLVDAPDTSLLVWTTTPWTLPANVAVAAHPEVDYVKVERVLPEGGKEYLILAEPLLRAVFGDEDVHVVERFKGTALRGKRYKPLFTFIPPEKPAHRVVLADFVTIEDGTGLVHIAPAFGAEDMNVALEEDLPVIQTVASDGTFIAEVRPWSGMFVKDADPHITRDLDARGLLFRAGTYTHTYPFCWRCSTPLLYYARPTWYIRTSQYRDRLVELNERINWYPAHIKNGRFGNWLENNIDWALGRERYWGTPLPVWECESCHHEHMVGSVKELSEMAGRDLSGLDLHRPHVDEVVLKCPECGGKMTRVPELIDVWFDSGSMPVAQWHYPFENQELFKKQFPADFICEAVDQTRGWFYSLHAISTLLFDSECYKNVICLGLILDKNGQKMSKSRGNIVDPWDVIRQHGADAMRWYLYTATPPGQERRFSAELVGEVVSNFTLTLWNTYSFFVTYANLDGWKPEAGVPVEYNSLDRWLLSALHALVRDVTEALEHYDVLGATRPVEAFVDQLSNWYLRRSRRRFWKSGSDADKKAAYATLYEALVTLSKLLAPTMPFLAEELYQNLVRSVDENAPLSVHMCDWPSFDPARIDEGLNREMTLVMKLASLGHAARNKANRKVRQPLQEVAFAVGNADEQDIPLRYADLLEDELNVKQVRMLNAAGEAVSYSLNPLPKQLGQKYGNRFPAIRQALLALDAAQAAQALLAGQSLTVSVNGETYEILPEEVEVRMQARSGYAVASEGAYLAALTTDLTPELIREGLAREFVRRVQDLRKNAGLDIADRIEVVYQASDGLAQAVEAFRDYIMNETLTLSLSAGTIMADMATAEDSFDGETVKIGLRKVSR